MSEGMRCPRFNFINVQCRVKQLSHDGCHEWSRNCLPFRSTWVRTGFSWGSCYPIFSFM